MALVEKFLEEIDSKWKPMGEEPITLQIIGSAALMLQTDYARGTKDSDVLESWDGSPAIKEQLLALAGKQTPLAEPPRAVLAPVDHRSRAGLLRELPRPREQVDDPADPLLEAEVGVPEHLDHLVDAAQLLPAYDTS